MDLGAFCDEAGLDGAALRGQDQLGRRNGMALAHFVFSGTDQRESSSCTVSASVIEAALQTLVLAHAGGNAPARFVATSIGAAHIHNHPGPSAWCQGTR